jgi:hypothetical protein
LLKVRAANVRLAAPALLTSQPLPRDGSTNRRDTPLVVLVLVVLVVLVLVLVSAGGNRSGHNIRVGTCRGSRS